MECCTSRVLVPNCFLSEASFHTGYTPSWTMEDIIGEGVNILTGRKIMLIDLGGYDIERHMEPEDVKVATRPEVRAVGSEGGHGYGWHKSKHCFDQPGVAVGAPEDDRPVTPSRG